MRILLTTHAFLPRSVAGVEVYTARLAAALTELGHSVQVLTAVHDLAAAPGTVRRVQIEGVDVVEVANPRTGRTLEATYRAPKIAGAIEQVLAEFRPECVHAQHLLNLSTELIPAAHRLGACTVLTLHDYWLSCARDGLRMRADGVLCREVDHGVCARCVAEGPYLTPPLQSGVLRLARHLGLGRALHGLHRSVPRLTTALMRSARGLSVPRAPAEVRAALEARRAHLRASVDGFDAVIAPTQFARERGVEWGLKESVTRVLGLGAIPGPTQPRRAGPRRRFAYLGGLLPHKGAHILVEAARRLRGDGWTLDLFGNASLGPGYARQLERAAGGDRRVRFHGPVSPGAQPQFWPSVDLLVVPSLWWENSPLVVLEALAAGVPVVASRTGGVPELIPEGAGLLVHPGDVPALAGALEAVLDGRDLAGPMAPLALKTAAEGARELVELYAALRESRTRSAASAAV